MSTRKKQLANGLWFDSQAEEAARFYTSIFPDSGIKQILYYGKEGREIHGQPEGKVMTVSFQLSGTGFQAINGGPLFTFNPSISFYVVTETIEETNKLWEHLSKDGMIMMALDKYEWSERYGFAQDRYGISWQVGLGKISDVGQKITPMLMFVGDQHGRAEEAVQFYTSVFKDSSIAGIHRYPAGADEPEGSVMHAQFKLAGNTFMAMDSAREHNFAFNEAISLIVPCETQAEIDYYWNKLTEDGEESACGWLKDRFGVSWQVEPVQLGEMLASPDKKRVEHVTKVFLKMKKFDLEVLEEAFEK